MRIHVTNRRLVRTVFPSGRSIDNTYVDGLLTRTSTPDGDIVYEHSCGGKVQSITMGSESLQFTYEGSLLTSLTQAGELDAAFAFQYSAGDCIVQSGWRGRFVNDNGGLQKGGLRVLASVAGVCCQGVVL